MKYMMRIELLSDICPSSGEVYNSSVDTEIDYDSYGFPFLSAKRLKGCLRETALFLREWGKEIPLEEIFGAEGNRNSALRLENARLEQYENLKADIDKLKKHSDETKRALSHPQTVLSLYSYVRTQTAMENCVAKEGSLRVLRVLKKGLCFEAHFTLDEKYLDAMQMICQATRNMGMNRTRGLGEIRITIETGADFANEPAGYPEIVKKQLKDAQLYRLYYRIHLLESIVLKSVNRGQEKTQDYIEGSKMLGILASGLGNQKYQALTTDKKIYCSNLYITDSETRYTPVSASIQRKKDDVSGRWYDMAAGYVSDEQMQKAGNVYALMKNQQIQFLSVDTQLRYHHARPADKSVGRALGEGEGEFYQMSSILDNQMFAGYVQCTGEQMKEVLALLANKRYIQIGYGQSAEYGKVELYLDNLKEYQEIDGASANVFAVKLDAPLIMYNAYGMYSQEPADLVKLIGDKLGTPVNLLADQMFLKYTMIGGWQRMWQRPKQSAYVLDKGSILLMQTENGQNVSFPAESIFIGERCVEGYGETRITEVSDKAELFSFQKQAENGADSEELPGSEIVKQLLYINEQKMLKKAGRVEAQQFVEKTNAEKLAPVVHKLLLTLKEQQTEEHFKEVCFNIKTDSKRLCAENIYNTLKNMPKCQEISRQESFLIYMKSFLTEAKYLVR